MRRRAAMAASRKAVRVLASMPFLPAAAMPARPTRNSRRRSFGRALTAGWRAFSANTGRPARSSAVARAAADCCWAAAFVCAMTGEGPGAGRRKTAARPRRRWQDAGMPDEAPSCPCPGPLGPAPPGVGEGFKPSPTMPAGEQACGNPGSGAGLRYAPDTEPGPAPDPDPRPTPGRRGGFETLPYNAGWAGRMPIRCATDRRLKKCRHALIPSVSPRPKSRGPEPQAKAVPASPSTGSGQAPSAGSGQVLDPGSLRCSVPGDNGEKGCRDGEPEVTPSRRGGFETLPYNAGRRTVACPGHRSGACPGR